MKSQNMKYQCGCGKIYSSYPAFSNHKKNKHSNNNQPGTNIPKPYNPKRGRPSFTLPQKEVHSTYSTYSALTCIQIGLLKLQDKFKGVLSETDDEADLDILNDFQKYEKIAANKTALRLISAIKEFSSTLVTHMNDGMGIKVVEYFTSVTQFLLQNLSSEQISLNWDVQLDENCFKIDSSLFNRYFQQRGQMERVREMGGAEATSVEFFLSLTVLLSEYLCILNLSNSTLALKA